MEFTEERNNDLRRAFRELAKTASKIIVPSIFKELVNMPSARFWVSEERAAIVVARIELCKPLTRMRATKREMFMEIYRRYKELRKSNPNASLNSLVEIVVHQPAPKFYLAPGYAMKVFYNMRRCSKQPK